MFAGRRVVDGTRAHIVASSKLFAPFSTVSNSVKVVSPYNGEIVTEVPYVHGAAIKSAIDKTSNAQKEWQQVPLEKRIDTVKRFVEALTSDADNIAADISKQMGKPLSQSKNEVKGLISRIDAFMNQAKDALADTAVTNGADPSKFKRKLVREPVGVVAVVAPWNYPLLTAGNAVIPAVLAGNGVVLKHSPQTPLCGIHFQRAFEKAGVPEGLVTSLMVTHDAFADTLVPHPAVGFVAFTGSVAGGRAVYKTVAERRFIDVGLELGGKDAMYVADDADLNSAVENAVDGACYNAGQSCCAIERVFVHRSLYPKFLDQATNLFASYKLGDPFDPSTNMGPVALSSSVSRIQHHIKDAKTRGAKILAGGVETPKVNGNTKGLFVAPTLVADCTQDMYIMKHENFGPVLAVQPVDSDEEAVALMNNTSYGLTASIWTNNIDKAEKLMPELNAGTVFMNRCDYLDPYLVWTGRGTDSGKGASMGHQGFHAVTKLKSVHYKANV